MLYFLFFFSGLSGLIYQVIWVRVFGNVFGNTVYSASLVVAVFMLGLGLGAYVVGRVADSHADSAPDILLRAYGYVEVGIAGLGLIVSILLPHLDRLSALMSSYSQNTAGWHVLSPASYLARSGIVILLLSPITLLMGGTLTLLVRHVVRCDVVAGRRRIAALYAVNTFGAAAGAFLTDFALVPGVGLFATQITAVALNLAAGVGAIGLARFHPKAHTATAKRRREVRPLPAPPIATQTMANAVAVALVLSGFAAMGMEILWFRHLTILLGGFRAVFSLLLTIVLAGIASGSLLSVLVIRTAERPAAWLMATQGLFVAAALVGLTTVGATPIPGILDVGLDSAPAAAAELWFNLRPMLVELALPALLMGFSFPLANAVVQRVEGAAGRRAGALYLANTIGAVAGSFAAGFLLLPLLGIQASAAVLAVAAALAIVPLQLAQPSGRMAAGSLAIAAASIATIFLLPRDYVIARALARSNPDERQIALHEGVNEVVEVTEIPGEGRRLLTNGHPMSATTPLSQRYMRALASVPLLAMNDPRRVLVIGFGVGNSTHAAALHPSVTRVDVADLSQDVLKAAGHFSASNGDVLDDRRVSVYVNDGRQHLHMHDAGPYDVITLEPPPISYAGVAALYSKEFYELARSRLVAGGYLSQWLPAYQVPSGTTLAMIRSFIEVFPQAVLLSGAEAELILIGTTASRIEVDPARLAASLARAPAVQADLAKVDLGSVREIAGMFVGSAQTLAAATAAVVPVTDDRPIQEYSVRSLLNFGEAVPAAVVDLAAIRSWCPACFADGGAPVVDGLDVYVALLGQAYHASPAEVDRTRRLAQQHGRRIAGSAYLGAIVPESAEVHNILGIDLARRGRLDAAIDEFRRALTFDTASARTHWHLGSALAARGDRAEAIDELQRSVHLDPTNADARQDLTALTAAGR